MDRKILLASLGGVASTLSGAQAEQHAEPATQALLSTYVTNVGDLIGTDPVPVAPRTVVALMRMPEHEHDASTIIVAAPDGRIIGYLPTNQSRIMAPLLDSGMQATARVAAVKNFPRPSVRIEIALAAPAPPRT